MSLYKAGKMQYRFFGNSGLSTSIISLGNMVNSRQETYKDDEELIKTALQNGINHFDTAEVYHFGKAETQLGNILKNLNVGREEVIIATKIRVSPNPDINSNMLINRKHIREGL
jgi:aryl-alcohol dehydrogenase-like predicted oxidoreductase